MKISIVFFIFFGLTIASCSQKSSISLVPEEKLCFDNASIIAIDMLSPDLANEVTIVYRGKNSPKEIPNSIYIQITRSEEFKNSWFMEDIKNKLTLLKVHDLPEVNDLYKVSDKSNAGVFHLFDKHKELNVKAYVGTCFTLSESFGECGLVIDQPPYSLKVDIPLKDLYRWKELQSILSSFKDEFLCR